MALDLSSVDDLRQRGNHEFQQGNLENALALYTTAVDQAGEWLSSTSEPKSSHGEMRQALQVNLCNRSAVHFKMQNYEQSLEDAQRAWILSEHQNSKAAYRLAKTYSAMGDPSQAVTVLKQILQKQILDKTQQSAFQELLQQAQTQLNLPPQADLMLETDIRSVQRPVSIREFIRGQQLGVGNFSEIVIVTHKVTQQTFALKQLEKKQAADLAKRQHPNVYNEIAMERRILLERLPPHPFVIRMYHAFQDYQNIYYLMDLHNVNTDLWSCLRWQGQMVGTHPSCIKQWMFQLVDALEHLHSHGIVHRDLKPENVLLNARNHIVVLDFGTAKDLIQTDLNGPEFVGTPDFMSPEAVHGSSDRGADHAADLWALGAMVYILHTGACPFWSPSPYLTFLRIKRGLLRRDAWAMPEQETWDFCSKLMQVEPSQRLGANCFKVEHGKVTVNKGYEVLRQHAYFQGVSSTNSTTQKQHIIPSLQDLAIRACASLAVKDSLDLDLCDAHPPGDKSSHDMTRLDPKQQALVWHVLEKLKIFKGGDETRVFARFFTSDVDFLKQKIRPASRDFVGLTQMNDDEYKPPSQRGSQDPYAKKDDPEPTKVVLLRNPLLVHMVDMSKDDPAQKDWLKGWKNSIATINKIRPKAVVVCAPHIPPKCWKFLARIRDSIPVVWNDGSVFYSWWLNGFQGLMIQTSGFEPPSKDGTIEDTIQMKWLREQMEQSRMAKQQVFAFCDCDPRELPELVLKRLARGRVLCLYGISEEALDYTIEYAPNEVVGDDNVSVKSTDSDEDEKEDACRMRVIASSQNGLEWLTVDEKEHWWTSFEAVDMPNPNEKKKKNST